MRDTYKSLIFLLLVYTLIALGLDYTFPIPKHEWVKGTIALGYWLTIFTTMFLLAYSAFPEAFSESKAVVGKLQRPLLFVGVLVTAVMLAMNILAGGGIRSPYVSFLSSFPMFFMVLLFEVVTIKACMKGATIALGSLGSVFMVDFSLRQFTGRSISVDEKSLVAFLGSESAEWLAIFVLAITGSANLISIYLGSRRAEQKDEPPRLAPEGDGRTAESRGPGATQARRA